MQALGGVGNGPAFCSLFGTTVPLSPSQMAALYPSHAQFVVGLRARRYWGTCSKATLSREMVLSCTTLLPIRRSARKQNLASIKVDNMRAANET